VPKRNKTLSKTKPEINYTAEAYECEEKLKEKESEPNKSKT
jgi:hypothetical protein